MLDKIIDFLKPWTHVMKRIQSLQVPSIHTVTPSIFVINSSLGISQVIINKKKVNDYNFLYLLLLNNFFFTGIDFFRQREQQVIKELISFDSIHLMEIFFNPKTQKMKQLSTK